MNVRRGGLTFFLFVVEYGAVLLGEEGAGDALDVGWGDSTVAADLFVGRGAVDDMLGKGDGYVEVVDVVEDALGLETVSYLVEFVLSDGFVLELVDLLPYGPFGVGQCNPGIEAADDVDETRVGTAADVGVNAVEEWPLLYEMEVETAAEAIGKKVGDGIADAEVGIEARGHVPRHDEHVEGHVAAYMFPPHTILWRLYGELRIIVQFSIQL